MKFRQGFAAFLIAIGCVTSSRAADQYWEYQYKQINVTAEGSSGFARDIAHKLYRLELAMAAVLESNATWRPTIDVYAVPAETFAALSGQGKDEGSLSKTTPYSSTLLINTSQLSGLRWWSAYFAFGSSMFITKYSARYPPWFRAGMNEVLAASTVEYSKVVIGGANPGRAYTVLHGEWIPIQVLLTVRGNDPQMSSRAFQDMYYAETWYLVHKIVIDQFHRAAFFDYFHRLDAGEDESKAFAESFDISYESLNEALRKSVTADKFSHYTVKIDGGDDNSQPVKASPAEANAKLAVYAAEHGVRPELAMELSAAALQQDPTNENAKMARIRAELRMENRDAALSDANGLCDQPEPSPKVTAACGLFFASLSYKQADKTAQAELRMKAIKFLEQSVQREPDNVLSWYEMSRLVIDTHDVAYAKAFIPGFTGVRSAHSNLGGLSGSLASLYSLTGETETAMKYAQVWQRNSMSAADKASAASFIAALKSASERKRAADAGVAAGAQPKP